MRRDAVSGWNAHVDRCATSARDAVGGWTVPNGRNAIAAIGCLLVLSTPLAAQTSGGFETMAQHEETAQACIVPRPPRDLAKTAYIRNGYRAILRILAVRLWQETGSCDCVINDITWDQVVLKGEEFVTRNDPLRPFDTSELRLLADSLEAERTAACKVD
ncbi:hypothetical protein TRP8649_04504 [Pelagimonas phthalicica]|uniref:Uncharacterized protein n=1 Tax=Pelagimonas phthalicica TaxID=1037362 RepID=A0A238JI54_9RHOB|nr:hypothetical protein [Pelagimonas phthalicica]MDP7151254.1 hypothetical protein [Paracoccaceae bacterium]TDS88742.1 hypothetical protein CLV87_4557 [Pelagimonas phthalicica]SMX30361.1 hypothetical protein TRP8649_04504 [Pelagimonas phthalicica]